MKRKLAWILLGVYVAILCGLVAYAAGGAIVEVDTSKGPVTLEIREVSAEPEGPAWYKCPWKSNGVPADFHAKHFTAAQRWSVFGIPPGMPAPYGAEVKTIDENFWTGKPYESTFRMDNFEAVMAAFEPSELPTWLLIDAEKKGGRTARSWQVVDFLRANYPGIKLGSGPIPWTGPLSDAADLKRFDFTVTFMNPGSDDAPGYWGRMGEDFVRWVMRAKALGVPFSVFPQPVMKHPGADGSTRIHLVSIEDYEIALDICCRSPWGLFMWGVPEVVGLRETNPDGVAAIMAAWDAAVRDATTRPVVYITEQKDWRVETMLCAIAYHAGYDVEYHPTRPFDQTDSGDWHFYPAAGGEGIMLYFPRPVIDGTEYPLWRLFLAWFDTGYTLRERYANPLLRRTMRAYQQARGVELRERLGE